MNTIKYINELRAERDNIDEAITVLTRLAGGGKRRGRPPKWLGASTPQAEAPAPEKKRVFSAATRKRMSLAQKRRWNAA